MAKKKVLFIGIGFYDYEESIIQEFKKLDYEVDYFCEVPPNNLVCRFHSRMKNEKKLQEINRVHTIEIANHCGTDYDLVFVIKCENITIDALKIIKNKISKANFVLYLWDSIQRISGIQSKFMFFDRIYSFDRLDCAANENFVFNPLFFRDEYVEDGQDKKTVYDIYHLGWYHSDRLELIKKIVKLDIQNKIKCNVILFTGYVNFLIQSVFGGELKGNKKYLIFKPVSAQSNRSNILQSKATLDIAHPNQSGLTMRAIELLGLQRKIITTNGDIVNYDFYHPDNVLVIDRENPVLDLAFFETPYRPILKEVISQYTITNWLKRMV